MNFELAMRPFSANDVGHDCPFTPDADEEDMYLAALADEISGLDCVKSVTRSGFLITIDLNSSCTEADLKRAMRPFLSGEIARHIRVDFLRAKS